MEKHLFRTARTRVRGKKNPGLVSAVKALSLAARDLENSTTFLVRNVLSSFGVDGRLIPDPGENRARCLEIAAGGLAAAQILREPKALARGDELKALLDPFLESGSFLAEARTEASLPKEKVFKARSFGSPGTSPWEILDASVLDQSFRLLTSREGERLHPRLPANAAGQARLAVQERFSSWKAALKSFKKDPSGFEAPPRMPGYHSKTDLPVVSFQAQGLGRRLPSIDGRALFLDAESKTPLPAEGFKAWEDFDLAGLVAKSARRIGIAGAYFAELRLVPCGPDFYFETVFKVPASSPDGSLLARCEGEAKRKKVSPRKFPAFAKAFVAGLDPHDFSLAAGLDLGVNNVAGIAFANGSPSVIVSAGRIEARLETHDGRIDELLSSLCPRRLRDLRGLRDTEKKAGRRLPKPLFDELLSLETALAGHEKIIDARARRARDLHDLCHQTARGIVDLLVARGSQVLVIGRNKGWKQESDMGKRQNRRFHGIPHAKLIGMVRDKCELAGILAIETEESWTSKASFAAGEDLKFFEEGKEKEKYASANVFPSGQEGESRPAGTRRRPEGGKSKAQHQYETRDRGRWSRIHAEANGAYNILRKANSGFGVHAGLSSAFSLFYVSRRGLARFNIRNSNLKAGMGSAGAQLVHTP